MPAIWVSTMLSIGSKVERVGERVARIGGASPVQVHQPVRGVDADAVKFGL